MPSSERDGGVVPTADVNNARLSIMHPGFAQSSEEMIKILLVPVFKYAMPIGVPVPDRLAQEDGHVGLSNSQELLEHCLCFLYAPGLGITRCKPAAQFIVSVPSLL